MTGHLLGGAGGPRSRDRLSHPPRPDPPAHDQLRDPGPRLRPRHRANTARPARCGRCSPIRSASAGRMSPCCSATPTDPPPESRPPARATMKTCSATSRELVDIPSVTGDEKAFAERVGRDSKPPVSGFGSTRPLRVGRTWSPAPGRAPAPLVLHPPRHRAAVFPLDRDRNPHRRPGFVRRQGMLAAMVFAARRLREDGVCGFGLAFTVGEESGQPRGEAARRTGPRRVRERSVRGSPPGRRRADRGRDGERPQGHPPGRLRARGKAAHSAYPEAEIRRSTGCWSGSASSGRSTGARASASPLDPECGPDLRRGGGQCVRARRRSDALLAPRRRVRPRPPPPRRHRRRRRQPELGARRRQRRHRLPDATRFRVGPMSFPRHPLHAVLGGRRS